MKKYFDDGDLGGQLKRAADAARQNGSLDDGKLEDFYARVVPYLTREQAAKLRELIDSLKEN